MSVSFRMNGVSARFAAAQDASAPVGCHGIHAILGKRGRELSENARRRPQFKVRLANVD
jgi:hypothetical protein